jgi:hypothetical protein
MLLHQKSWTYSFKTVRPTWLPISLRVTSRNTKTNPRTITYRLAVMISVNKVSLVVATFRRRDACPIIGASIVVIDDSESADDSSDMLQLIKRVTQSGQSAVSCYPARSRGSLRRRDSPALRQMARRRADYSSFLRAL